MSKEVAITSWCDACSFGDVKTEAVETVVLSISPVDTPLELDFCQAHLASDVDPLRRLLDMYGAPVSKPAANPSVRTCHVCGHTVGTSSGMRDHMKRKHPEVIPAGTLACDQCGRTFETPQGLGAHRYRAHATAGTSKGKVERTPDGKIVSPYVKGWAGAAKYLGTSARTVRRAAEAQGMDVIQVGNRVHFSKVDLDKLRVHLKSA